MFQTRIYGFFDHIITYLAEVSMPVIGSGMTWQL